ncbi:FAD-dependent oxidoreductase [Rhizohabitans arisaemae]|uniref:FAD-dependent oxidoreductase n=1 Tax=Rhizohabitans arisaemae TaxID=2720610 RepID=UPI0024B11CF8|nr:FAD-dependent oxidoreductase [Rhizohabitans arisaemae]
MGDSADLVILGAGPAGLAAAWRAARRGLQVVVLERAERPGGLSAGFEVAGVRVDHGSHRLHPATPPALLADLAGLLGDDLQLRPRNGRLRMAGRWVGFPLKAGELARTLPKGLLLRVGRDALASPLRGGPRRDTFAEVVCSGLGPALYDALYAPYAEKLWGLPGERIDGDQARKRVTADSPWKMARRVLVKSAGPRGQGKVFHYPRRGFGQIVEALADAAVEAGADLRLGVAAGGIVPGADGVRVDGVEADQVFSTIPMPLLARIVEPGPPEPVLQAAGRLRFRAMTLVYVVHEGGRWTGFDAHYLPGPETPVTRISEPANYRVSADDPVDRTVLCFEIPCATDDEIWRSGDEELGALAQECLAVTGLPPVRRSAVVVRRLPHVYPVYELGYRECLAGLDAWARTIPRVTTFGRLGLFAHDNTHHAMTMGYDAVDALGVSGVDGARWSRARARFARHVVED